MKCLNILKMTLKASEPQDTIISIGERWVSNRGCYKSKTAALKAVRELLSKDHVKDDGIVIECNSKGEFLIYGLTPLSHFVKTPKTQEK